MASPLLSALLGEDANKFAAWSRATIMPGYDSTKYRKDRFGWWIDWNEYGKTSEYGWEVDHIHPVSLLGSDHENNLQALHWRNNRRKSNHVL
ncbi:HNH endonuclease signature motif containing protein [Mesorhizobium sp. VNQ89]|uniref:HNH endonuclease n=1 Tax=Mesorhizobium quangtriensis TaxID=3157709 RepID=UPI0032B8641B